MKAVGKENQIQDGLDQGKKTWSFCLPDMNRAVSFEVTINSWGFESA